MSKVRTYLLQDFFRGGTCFIRFRVGCRVCCVSDLSSVVKLLPIMIVIF